MMSAQEAVSHGGLVGGAVSIPAEKRKRKVVVVTQTVRKKGVSNSLIVG